MASSEIKEVTYTIDIFIYTCLRYHSLTALRKICKKSQSSLPSCTCRYLIFIGTLNTHCQIEIFFGNASSSNRSDIFVFLFSLRGLGCISGYMTNPDIQLLGEWIASAKSIAVLSGAGISTASGIPDFRSAGGIYSNDRNVNVFDLNAFRQNPSIFYNFARVFYPKVRNARPNAAHLALANWQRRGKNVTVITQNVDDYHQRAGSNPVYCVHGNYIYSSCQSCGARTKTSELQGIIATGKIPHCVCGDVFKPDITFFGEMLPEADWDAAVHAIRTADLVLVLGTSLVVYPAAGLPTYRNANAKLIIINHDPTPLDSEAQMLIHKDLCDVLSTIPV